MHHTSTYHLSINALIRVLRNWVNAKARFKISLASVLIGSVHLLSAQSIQIASDSSHQEEVYSYQYFDINDYEQSTLVKVGALSIIRNIDQTLAVDVIGVEQKVSRNVSVELEYDRSLSSIRALGARGRYFFNQKVNNFSGAYVGTSFFQRWANSDEAGHRNRSVDFGALAGYQIRKGRFSSFDLRGELTFNTDSRSLVFSVYPYIALSWGPSGRGGLTKSEYSSNRLRASRHQFTLYNPFVSISEHLFQTGLSLSYELMVFPKMSFRSSLGNWYSWQRPVEGSDLFESYWLSIAPSLRFYFLEDHRRQAGKQYFLAGPYVSYELMGLVGTHSYNPGSIEFSGLNHNLKLGYQERVSKSLIMDVFFGLGISNRSTSNFWEFNTGRYEANLISGATFGWVF